MDYYDGSWGAGHWVAMGSMMLMFWGVVIGLVVWAMRSYRRRPVRDQAVPGSSNAPDVVLAERYARGEIDEDEFVRRRELLRSAAGPPAEGGTFGTHA